MGTKTYWDICNNLSCTPLPTPLSSVKPESWDLMRPCIPCTQCESIWYSRIITISAHSNGTILHQVGEFCQLGKLSQCMPSLPLFLNAERWPTWPCWPFLFLGSHDLKGLWLDLDSSMADLTLLTIFIIRLTWFKDGYGWPLDRSMAFKAT